MPRPTDSVAPIGRGLTSYQLHETWLGLEIYKRKTFFEDPVANLAPVEEACNEYWRQWLESLPRGSRVGP